MLETSIPSQQTGLKKYVDDFIKMVEDKLYITDLLERMTETFKPEILNEAERQLYAAVECFSKAKEVIFRTITCAYYTVKRFCCFDKAFADSVASE